jgi:starch-binding outer membrane protein, SusD/RagB family
MRNPTLRTAALVSALGLSAACGLLDTDQPNIIDPGTLDSPTGATALRDGALADFGFAKDGDGTQNDDGLILVTGLLSDEFIHSTTPPSQQEIDQRTPSVDNPSVSDPYFNLHKARVGAENAAQALQAFALAPDETPDVAEMLAIVGFTYVYFGEAYCSGIPFGRTSGDSLAFGTPLTTAETFDTALARFDAALAHPGLIGDDGTITNLALVGRGRALLGQGRFAEAAAAVQAVPTEFQYGTEHSDSPERLQNAIWSYSATSLWSVANLEGGAGLPFRSGDPRVPVDSTIDQDTGDVVTGLDLITPQFTLLKYESESPVLVADGIEARLIEAEAQLQAVDLGGMTTTLNDLRGTLGLAPVGQPGTQDEAIDLLFSERGFWLFATGHRLGDMRRLVRPAPAGYGRPQASVFPTGAYHKQGSYGSDVNLPIPIEEENNPNSEGCLNRDP